MTPRDDAPTADAARMVSDPGRLAALARTDLLDAAREEVFDRLTRLASRILSVPISVVSLVDEDRQFFLSQCGISGEVAEARQTPLSHSFCQHVVDQSQALIVSDARLDPLVADDPAIADLDVLAYAGVPLRLSDGHVLGAFCAIEPQPRSWTTGELELLEDLSALAVAAIEARQALLQGGTRDRRTGLLTPDVATEVIGFAAAGSDEPTVAVGVTLPGFAGVMRSVGGEAADELLVEVARRLVDTAGPHAVVSRLGDEAFVVVWPAGMRSVPGAAIRDAVAGRPYRAGTRLQSLGAVVGETVMSGPVDVGLLLRDALPAA